MKGETVRGIWARRGWDPGMVSRGNIFARVWGRAYCCGTCLLCMGRCHTMIAQSQWSNNARKAGESLNGPRPRTLLPRRACASCPADAWRRFRRLRPLSKALKVAGSLPLAQTSFSASYTRRIQADLCLGKLKYSDVEVQYPPCLYFCSSICSLSLTIPHLLTARALLNTPVCLIQLPKLQPHVPVRNTYRLA